MKKSQAQKLEPAPLSFQILSNVWFVLAVGGALLGRLDVAGGIGFAGASLSLYTELFNRRHNIKNPNSKSLVIWSTLWLVASIVWLWIARNPLGDLIWLAIGFAIMLSLHQMRLRVLRSKKVI
ncbi:hypothetical protein [Streptomyces sp. NPDC088196]|uniref:hypothetical protein n=1 Tax=Streptomyces sp. NPDC088196 TaxID=3154868 RepID=UPI00344C165C